MFASFYSENHMRNYTFYNKIEKTKTRSMNAFKKTNVNI